MAANARFRRLFDYTRHRANIRCECDCGHWSILDAYQLKRWATVHRWNDAIGVIMKHLRCSKCGELVAHVRPVEAEPIGPRWGPQSEKDWERIIRRVRD